MSRELPTALLVEHDGPTRTIASMALDTLGFQSIAVASADEALGAIGDRVFAIAIIEARLPGAMSGIELAESLKMQIPSMPILVLGDGERPRDVLDAFHAGAADVLLKPFELPQLRAALARVLAGRSSDAAIDFHGRIELAKSSLEHGAFDVAQTHLRTALGANPLDPEAMNLFGLALELAGDFGGATSAYRAAYGFDAEYGRARRNLERVTEQFTYVGLSDSTKMDLFAACPLRIAVPMVDPSRDFSLLRVARAISTTASGVALGYLLDRPSEDGGEVRTVARRRAFLRAAGTGQSPTMPCVLHYSFEMNRGEAVRHLVDEEKCDLMVLGSWTPSAMRAALDGQACAVVTAQNAELLPTTAVSPDLTGANAALRLAIAVNVAGRLRIPVRLPAAPAVVAQASSVPAHVLFEQLELHRPLWLNGDLFVAVRVGDGGGPALSVGGPSSSLEV